jgi:NTP pyrophosphatase (non-canonical NTP hydrolase)
MPEDFDASTLTVSEIVRVNAVRRDRWHPPEAEQWSGADWSNAMCGEAGEAANVVKKIRRHETGLAALGQPVPPVEELMAQLGDELADVVCYLVLVADHYGIDLPAALVSKFNRVSERQGFPERLPAASTCAPCSKGFHRMCLGDGCTCRLHGCTDPA